MADVSVPNTFSDGTTADADEVNANFDALVSWVNTNAVRTDGSKVFTAHASGPSTDPSTDDQYSRKAYVDDKAGGLITRITTHSSGNTVTVKSSAVSGTAYNWSAFDYTLAEEDGHSYLLIFEAPSLGTNKDAILTVQATRVAAQIVRAGSTIARSYTMHDTDGDFGGVTVSTVYTASATASVAYSIEVLHRYGEGSTPANATIQSNSNSGYPVQFNIIDLGT